MTSLPLLLDGQPVASLDVGSFSAGAPSVASSVIQGETGVPAGPSVPGPSVPGTTGGATGPDGAQEPPPQGNPFQSLLMFGLIGAVIWFLIFAPEKKARKKRESMLDAVKKGDKVVTTGGLHAQVVEVKEREVTLKAGDVRLTFSRSSIHEIVTPKDEPSED